jgi:hypothetical protein
MQPPQSGSAGAQDETIVVEEHFIGYAFRPGLSIGGSNAASRIHAATVTAKLGFLLDVFLSDHLTNFHGTSRRRAPKWLGIAVWQPFLAESLLINPANPNAEPDTRDARAASAALGRELQVLPASNERDIEAVFTIIIQQRIGGQLVAVDNMFLAKRALLATLAVRHESEDPRDLLIALANATTRSVIVVVAHCLPSKITMPYLCRSRRYPTPDSVVRNFGWFGSSSIF